MNERVKRLTEEAQRLTPEEQAELLDALTFIVHGEDYEIDPALLEECERRWERYKRGETKLYTWEEVQERLRKL
jgi:putative addiction module component (TIGR02574 family)